MSWRTLTDSDVMNEGFNPSERGVLTALQSQDNLATIVGSVVAAVRGAILAGGGQLDADGTIPDQLRPDTIAMVRWAWLTSFPTLQRLQNPQREKANEDARDLLRAITLQRVKVELPAAGNALTSVQAPVNAVQTARPGRHIECDRFNDLGHS